MTHTLRAGISRFAPFYIFLCSFFAIRLSSWAFIQHDIIEGSLVFALLLLLGLLYYKHPGWALLLVYSELLLGGAGQFLQFGGLSLRTLYLATFLLLWAIHSLYTHKKETLWVPQRLFYSICVLFFVIGIAFVQGILHYPFMNVVRDALPFAFFLLLIPSYHLYVKEQTSIPTRYIKQLLAASIIGSAIWGMSLFILFVTGTEQIHQPFYNWIRDVAAGKITNMQTGFFRVVFPEHLFIPAAVLVLSATYTQQAKRLWLQILLLAASLSIMAINLSRAYLLALFVSFFILLYKQSWKQWLGIGLINTVLFLSIFFSLHLYGSGGQSWGLSLLGIRTQSIIQPQIEESTYTRMSLLPPIYSHISSSPLLGQGLGTTLTFMHPLSHTQIQTTQFDWGYLELWVKLGIAGLILILYLLLRISKELLKQIQEQKEQELFFVGILASTGAYMIITIFAPVFMHVFGVVLLVATITLLQIKQKTG